MATANSLQGIVSATKSINSRIAVKKKVLTIALEVASFSNVDGKDVVTGLDIETGKTVTVQLQERGEGQAKSLRDMDAISDVTEVGQVIVCDSCIQPDASKNEFVSGYIYTPHNVVISEGQQKEVNVDVLPGRLIRTESGRNAAILYNVTDSIDVRKSSDLVDYMKAKFADGKGVLVRPRILGKDEETSEEIKLNNAFEFFPVYDRVQTDKGVISEVNVEASLQAVADSEFGESWLNDIDSENTQQYLGKEINIDATEIIPIWFGVARGREDKENVENYRYGLADGRTGFFASLRERFLNESGQTSTSLLRVSTKLIVATQTLTDASGTRTFATLARPLSTHAKFLPVADLPMMRGGQLVYAGDQSRAQVRLLKGDGTFINESATKKAADKSSQSKAAVFNDKSGTAADKPAQNQSVATAKDVSSSPAANTVKAAAAAAVPAAAQPVAVDVDDVDFDNMDMDLDLMNVDPAEMVETAVEHPEDAYAESAEDLPFDADELLKELEEAQLSNPKMAP